MQNKRSLCFHNNPVNEDIPIKKKNNQIFFSKFATMAVFFRLSENGGRESGKGDFYSPSEPKGKEGGREGCVGDKRGREGEGSNHPPRHIMLVGLNKPLSIPNLLVCVRVRAVPHKNIVTPKHLPIRQKLFSYTGCPKNELDQRVFLEECSVYLDAGSCSFSRRIAGDS